MKIITLVLVFALAVASLPLVSAHKENLNNCGAPPGPNFYTGCRSCKNTETSMDGEHVHCKQWQYHSLLALNGILESIPDFEAGEILP